MMAALGLESYTAVSIVIIVATAFVSGLARGFSGFGAALIFMPIASAFMSAQIASPLLLIVDMIIAIPLIPNALHYADRREVALMVLGSLIGIPLGTWALAIMNPLAVRWMIVALIVPMLALLMSGWRYPGRATATVTAIVGGISGFFNGVAQVGGPPIVLYWLRDAGKAVTMRANIILFFAISSVITTVSYLAGGLLSHAIIGLAVAIGPAYAIGLWLGSHMFWLASEATFRRVCYALIAMAALVSLPVFDGFLR
jgi:uncharacterized membrane protein YfcA